MAQRPRHKDKAHEALMRELEAAGWRCERRNSGHWRCLCPCEGKHFISFGSTASDHRAFKNMMSNLRTRTCWGKR